MEAPDHQLSLDEKSLKNQLEEIQGSEENRYFHAVKQLFLEKWLPFHNVSPDSIHRFNEEWEKLPDGWKKHFTESLILFFDEPDSAYLQIKASLKFDVTFMPIHKDEPKKAKLLSCKPESVAFTGEYVYSEDNLPKRFLGTLDYISKKWSPNEHVAPYTSLIQSSGYGKTRLICHLPKVADVFVIYSCYRPTKDNGYPGRSFIIDSLMDMSGINPNLPMNTTPVVGKPFINEKDVVDISGLAKKVETLSLNQNLNETVDASVPMILKFSAFHCACIQVLLSEMPKTYDKKRFNDFCQSWLEQQINFLTNERDGSTFWRGVLQKMLPILEVFVHEMKSSLFRDVWSAAAKIDSIQTFNEQMRKLLLLRPGSLTDSEKTSLIDSVVNPTIVTTVNKYRSVMSSLGFGVANRKIPLIVSVSDEARALIDPNDVKSLFHYHRSSCGLFPSDSSFVAVYMDTSARLTNFQPKDEDVVPPSYRSSKGTQLFKPFHLVNTTDLMSRNNDEKSYLKACIACQKNYTAEDHRLIQSFLFHLGRPLWGSHLDADNTTLKLRNVLLMAKQKLSRTKSADYSTMNDDKVFFSLFQLRARLFMNPNLEYATDMVADYMATLMDITPNRDELKIDYPSDPTMCEAATEIMNSPNFPSVKMLQVVNRLMKEGLVSGGLKGELVAKYLLLVAFDSACKRLAKKPSQSVNPAPKKKQKKKNKPEEEKSAIFETGEEEKGFIDLTRPMKVLDFLITLTGNALIAEDLEGQVSNKKLNELLRGTIMFNHFISVDYTPKMTEMKDFFLRGAAIDRMPHQEAIDFIIPILLENKTFSAILIQVKNYQKTYDPIYSQFCHKMTPYGCGMDVASSQYPYLSLYMQLGSIYKNPRLDTERKLGFSIASLIEHKSTKKQAKLDPNLMNELQKAKLDQSLEELKADLEKAENSRSLNQVHLVFFGMDQMVYPFLDHEIVRPLKALLRIQTSWMDDLDKDKAEIVRQMIPLAHK